MPAKLLPIQPGEIFVASFDRYQECIDALPAYAKIVKRRFPGYGIVWEPRKVNGAFAICAAPL